MNTKQERAPIVNGSDFRIFHEASGDIFRCPTCIDKGGLSTNNKDYRYNVLISPTCITLICPEQHKTHIAATISAE